MILLWFKKKEIQNLSGMMCLWQRKFIWFSEFHHVIGLVLESEIWVFPFYFPNFIGRCHGFVFLAANFISFIKLSLPLFLPWELFGLIIIFSLFRFFLIAFIHTIVSIFMSHVHGFFFIFSDPFLSSSSHLRFKANFLPNLQIRVAFKQFIKCRWCCRTLV